MAPSEITDQVKRWASLGRETFEEKIGDCLLYTSLNYKYELKKKESLGAIVHVALFLWFSRNSHSV